MKKTRKGDCFLRSSEDSIVSIYGRSSQLSSVADHKGPKPIQRYVWGPNEHYCPLCFYAFRSWQRADQEWLVGRIWPTGCLLRTPDLWSHIIDDFQSSMAKFSNFWKKGTFPNSCQMSNAWAILLYISFM